MYKLTYKETILEEYRDTLTFNQPTSADTIHTNYLINITNGNILDCGNDIDPTDPYIRHCWVIFKDQATAEMIFAENSTLVPDIYRSLDGFYAYDISWSSV